MFFESTTKWHTKVPSPRKSRHPGQNLRLRRNPALHNLRSAPNLRSCVVGTRLADGWFLVSSEQRKKPSYFTLYGLVNRDPSNGLLQSLYNLTNQGFFHCSRKFPCQRTVEKMILNPKSWEGGGEIYPLDPWKMVYFTYIYRGKYSIFHRSYGYVTLSNHLAVIGSRTSIPWHPDFRSDFVILKDKRVLHPMNIKQPIAVFIYIYICIFYDMYSRYNSKYQSKGAYLFM